MLQKVELIRELVPIMHFLGLAGIVSAIPFVQWTRMTLGAVLLLMATLVPDLTSRRAPRLETGRASIKLPHGLAVTVSGGLRVFLAVAGIILMLSELLMAYER